jgi:hypothetical protein
MRPPADRRPDAEIVADIMKIVDCPPFEGVVRGLINNLRAELPLFTGRRTRNVEWTIETRKLAVKLRHKLEAPESQLLSERFWQLASSEGGSGEFNPQARTWIGQDPRPMIIKQALDWTIGQANRMIELEIGEHGHAGTLSRHCAIAASEMLQTAANYNGTELKLTYTSTGAFCRLTAFFSKR